MLEFKIDVIAELDKKGWNVKRIIDNKLIGTKTYYAMKNNGTVPGIKTINTLCKLLGRQPGYFLRYVPDRSAGEDLQEKTPAGSGD